MKRLRCSFCSCRSCRCSAQESFHRAEQDREIRYWLLDPATHQFRISHDFTVTRAGQKSVHSFVRKGSVVSPDAKMIDLDSGKELKTHTVSGKDVNALGYYPTPTDPDSVVGAGRSRAIRWPRGARRAFACRRRTPIPSATSSQDGELTWKRTLGRPVNYVTLPAGWMLTSVNTPAIDLARRRRARQAALHQHPQRRAVDRDQSEAALIRNPVTAHGLRDLLTVPSGERV